MSSSHEPRLVLADGLLLGLAPNEVYRATLVTKSAVSSYLALSPLPALLQAVCFLLHFLSRYRAWTLSSILLFGARTFLQLAPAVIRYSCPNIERRSWVCGAYSSNPYPKKLQNQKSLPGCRQAFKWR